MSEKASKVYFTSMRTKAFGKNLLQKLDELIVKAGIEKLGLNRKYVAIKIHFGERGNMAFVRPNYARVLVDRVKALGGRPFLTDCSTLYVGSRKDAIEHMETAMLNGFVPEVAGCPVIIGDGLKGTDEVDVPVRGGIDLKSAKIGRAVMDADVVISLNHFKGHEMTGFGGAIKNLGMGCGSRAGKMAMHCLGKVKVDAGRCIGCGKCKMACAHGAPNVTGGKCAIDSEKCLGCGRCIGACNFDAISPASWDGSQGLDRRMAEYAWAVIDGRPNFHVNLVMDVSPFCDCHAENDAPIVPNIGFFASFDPVALDRACADAVNAKAPIADSLLGESHEKGRDNFGAVSPSTDWKAQLEHSEKLGIGTQNYELVEIKID